MKRSLLALLVMLFSASSFAAVCEVQVRTWQKNANPTDVWYGVGETNIVLNPNQQYDIYIQYKSASANPYLLEASVSVDGGNALVEKNSSLENGSVRVVTGAPGTSSRISYKINGRSDGKPLNIPSGCLKGHITVQVAQQGPDWSVLSALVSEVREQVKQAAIAISRVDTMNHGVGVSVKFRDLFIGLRDRTREVELDINTKNVATIAARTANLRAWASSARQQLAYESYTAQRELQYILDSLENSAIQLEQRAAL